MKHRNLIAGGLVLAMLVVGTAILYVSTPLSNARISIRIAGNDLIFVEADEERRFVVDGSAALTIDSDEGNIVIAPGQSDEIVIQAHKKAWGSDQADAEDRLALMKLDITQTGNAIQIRFDETTRYYLFGSTASGRIDLDIRVPVTTTIDASTRNGDFNLSGSHGDAKLHTGFGVIEATDVHGDLIADTRNGQINAHNVQAGALIDLSSAFGDIIIRDSTTVDIKVTSRNGQLTLTGVQASGDATLESEFGALAFEQSRAATLSANTRNGAIELRDLTIEGEIQAESHFGRMTLEHASSVSYDLHTRRGPIDVTGTLGAGPHVIETDFGGIHLTLPGNSALTIDLQTGFGRIRSALPVLVTETLDNTHWRGTINGGGASLTAHTRNGDIVLDTQE